jgi:hypothetical protein
MEWEVPIIYHGQCNFIVEADSAEAAKKIAADRFNAGDSPTELGNEWEEIERVAEPEKVK